jgi:hypothetical protein
MRISLARRYLVDTVHVLDRFPNPDWPDRRMMCICMMIVCDAILFLFQPRTIVRSQPDPPTPSWNLEIDAHLPHFFPLEPIMGSR